MATQHKSMRGRPINMDALRIQNEKVIALGNMGVNAAGDELGKGGKIIKTSAQRVAEANALHTMRPEDMPIQRTPKKVIEKKVTPGVEEAERLLTRAEAILDEADKPIIEDAPLPKKKTTKKKSA